MFLTPLATPSLIWFIRTGSWSMVMSRCDGHSRWLSTYDFPSQKYIVRSAADNGNSVRLKNSATLAFWLQGLPPSHLCTVLNAVWYTAGLLVFFSLSLPMHTSFASACKVPPLLQCGERHSITRCAPLVWWLLVMRFHRYYIVKATAQTYASCVDVSRFALTFLIAWM